MRRLSNRSGVALPTAILVLAVLTVVITAGFIATNAEISSNTVERGAANAYVVAQHGLEQFLVRRADAGWCQHCTLTGPNAPPNADSEWTRVTTRTGYADIVSRRVHVTTSNTDPSIYFIASHGVDTVTRISSAAAVRAERTVGLYAKSSGAAMNVQAGWTGLSGISKTGRGGSMSGIDACGSDSTRAGVTAPIHTWSQSGPFAPTGAPAFDTMRSVAQIGAAMKLDWAGIVGGAITPTIVIPGGSFPSAAAFADTTYWPIIRIHTNGYTLPTSGQGIVIADSDVSLSGPTSWTGIILVGGQLAAQSTGTFSGATLTGLNRLLGGNPGAATVQGNRNYLYNSCAVSRAAVTLTQAYTPIPNSWMDNIAIY